MAKNKAHTIKCSDETWWALKQVMVENRSTIGSAFTEVMDFYVKEKGIYRKTSKR